MNVILIAVIVLACIGLVAAIVLFAVSRRFAVHEDPRLAQVAALLPQANCGGCGYPGCSGFASACVKAADKGSLDGKLCPVGGQVVMQQVANALGMTVDVSAPKVAVVRCNGTCENRPRLAQFDGARSCRIQQMTGMGETGCSWGCLGCGDCASACQFGALAMNAETGLPEVDETKCTACGVCAKACPRGIIEIRLAGPKGRRMVVLCNNKDKGVVANKVCKVSCIGCGKCMKICDKFHAITLDNNLAYIDAQKCKMCRKCEEECPKHVIHAFNFPPRKPKPEATAQPKPAPQQVAKPAPTRTETQKEAVTEQQQP